MSPHCCLINTLYVVVQRAAIVSGEFEPEELPPKEGEEEKAEATSSESKEEEGKCTIGRQLGSKIGDLRSLNLLAETLSGIIDNREDIYKQREATLCL
jgi:hypothetical protein